MDKLKIKDLNYCSSLESTEVLKELDSSPQGLSEQESQVRLAEYGPNRISEKKELSIFLEFLSHFKSPLIIVLFIAIVISAFFGEITNSIIIGIMVLLSVVLDFFEEHSAGKAAEKLKEKVETTATVIRNNHQKEIRTTELCPGDILVLSAGDLIPADARLIAADDFFVNQSALTGESYPCEKKAGQLKMASAEITELTNIVFLGTNVISGYAQAVVVKTGQQTKFGEIARDLTKPEQKSDFEIGITKFGFFIMKIIFVLVLAIFLINSLIHHQILESFLFAIAIAVGITPELLPMIMSITMARGSLKMSKRGVIVKKLSAIPSFGSMDVLCTDKTGTLTEGNITLVTYVDIFGKNSEDVLLHAYLGSFYQTGIKSPLEKAVLDYREIPTNKYKKKEEIPFDFERKMMSIVVAGLQEKQVLITKGAPEEVFKKCNYYRKDNSTKHFDQLIQNQATGQYQKLSREGFRVLAVAIKPILQVKEQYSKEEESNLELLGFVSFLDPAKKDIKGVLQELSSIGVAVKVITGDDELVAQKICWEVGLQIKGILLGKDTANLSDDALRIKAEKTTIFARFSPDEKNRVINILRKNNHVVGYLGDGINDAPSLASADVGISVNNAVDVAKEAADIVLTQKSLEVLRDGIIEGRKVFGNTMKYILMGLSSNFGNMFSVLGAIFFIPFLPMLPIQILLNNFIYDFSQVTIPMDNVDRDWIDKPRRWDLKFIRKFMYTFGPISSFYDILTFLTLYFVFHAGAAMFQTGWFMESLATQTLIIHIIRTKQTPFFQSTASKSLLISTVMGVAFGWIIPYTLLGKFFKFEPLSLNIVLAIVGIVILYLITVEIAKRIFYKHYDFQVPIKKNSV